jgi:AraC-like DNA-binding protein
MKKSIPAIYLYKRIVQAKLFIDANYGECIDLNNISGEAHFSKFHFIRLFKNIYGLTPHQYLIKVRIDNAKRLLEKGLSVTDTCFRVGFDSSTSFTSLFKKLVSVSPSLYQAEYRKRQDRIKAAPLEFIPNCFAEEKGWKQ